MANLKYSSETPDPFPGPLVKEHGSGCGKGNGGWCYRLTPEQEEWLRRWHPRTENKVLEQMSGLSHAGLAKHIKRLGLKKDTASLYAMHSERRKELMRKERRRVEWAIGQQTKIYIPLTPFNCAQLSCRMHALEKGYVLDADYKEGSPNRWKIFYDDDTPRDPRFEKNCNKNGFKVERWKD